MIQLSHRETPRATIAPGAGRGRSLVAASAILAVLLAVSLFADPTIWHDARGGFVSWNLAFDMGYEAAPLDARTMIDDEVHDLGIHSIRNWRIALVGSWVLSVVATLLLFVDRRALVRIAATVLFLACATTVYTYQQFDTRFSPAVARMFLSEVGTADEYVPIVVGSALSFFVALVVLLLVVHWLAGRYVPRVRTAYSVLLATLTFASTVWISVETHGILTNASPLFKVPAAFAVNALMRSTFEIPEREAVYFEPSRPPKVANIVVLVDESVTGKYLQLNGFRMPNTPFLSSGAIELFNFGDAASVYPFTEYSHHLLQSGVRIEQLPDYKKRIYALPSLFQYAKSAGFQTAFVDGQYNNPKHSRNPIVQEIDYVRYIDAYVSMQDEHGEADANTDYRVADEILDRLEAKRGEPNLIYAFKQGLHIPFELRYPATGRVFTPTLDGDEWRTDRPEESANSYSNGVLWSVDGLLRYLVEGLASRGLENTVVVYTSDHANRQHFGGADRLTEYYSVPLVVFPVKVDEALRTDLLMGSRLNRDKVSHVDLFPSVLVLMGYDKALVNQRYGSTIFDSMGRRARTVFAGDIFGTEGEHRFRLAAADDREGSSGTAVDLSDVFGSASSPQAEP